ncbi:MAG: DUF1501 domain-containing protein [Pirellulales bacterium]|nr:DUF1501 domain-containing protein [Pirellulales bacterium]
MLRFDGQPHSLCDRLSRRDVLHVGSLAALGLGLPELLAARCARAQSPESSSGAPLRLPAKAQACIFVYLFGGPSQLDTWDLKPDAPTDFRGPFRPIATRVPGLEICEHFPHLAQVSDKLTIVRSMHHEHPRHGYGLYYAFTGRPHARPDLDAAPDPSDFPSLGSLVARLRQPRAPFPQAITVPRWNRFLDLPQEYAGETAGFLGRGFDPWLIRAEPNTAQFHVAGVELPAGITLDRLAARHDLLARLDRELAASADELEAQKDTLYAQAFALVASARARRAFALEQEPAALRERYGASPFGQALLLARRLVEAGTALVTVNWHEDGSDVKSPFWDTHKDNFNTLERKLIPPVDRGLAALLGDLDERGLLDDTLIVVLGEFGRTPRIGRVVMNAATDATGRDHWPHAYSVLMAGGGIARGRVYGSSDDRGAYVASQPITPPELTATILDLLGVDLSQRIYDRQNRPHDVAPGAPVRALYA